MLGSRVGFARGHRPPTYRVSQDQLEPYGNTRTLATVQISELQEILRTTYFERDAERGRDATFRWMTEEVGELAKAFRTMDPADLEHEFGDVLAWVTSLANLTGVDLERAAARYANGCPRCGASPCTCAFDR